jgi:biopolymer transport protein ExbD
MTALREALRGRTTDQDVDVVPDDGLAYAEVIGVMDAVIGEGFVRVSVVD